MEGGCSRQTVLGHKNVSFCCFMVAIKFFFRVLLVTDNANVLPASR